MKVLTWLSVSQYGSSACLAARGAQYWKAIMAWIVERDFTDAAIHHLILPLANDDRTGNMARSRGRAETAHPRAQITENRVNEHP
jgi:hypothetical protein